MIRNLAPLRLGAALGCALALGGCISVLPKSKPVQLYRFGEPAAAASPAQAAPAPTPVGVFKTSGVFQRESAGDRMFTVTGAKVAYIAQARWAAPAEVMFDQAVMAAFDADAGAARLVSRGEPVAAKFMLRIDVRNFETDYDHGPRAAPDILVRVRASMVHAADHNQAPEQIFEVHVRARDNRVGAIVAAYDKATADVLRQLVAWTDAQVAGG